MPTVSFRIEREVPLAPLTTLDVGGPARELIRVTDRAMAGELVRWWLEQPSQSRPRLLPLGGGSNLLIGDHGFEGLVLKMENREFEILSQSPQSVEVRVGAGMVWDELVALSAEKGWAGIECLSGIPGCVGAAPVQNIGAYGQDVSETIVEVEGYHLVDGSAFRFSNEECEFAYRDSRFKRAPRGSFLITAVTFRLRPGGQPTLRYKDLQERCQQEQVSDLTRLRELVLEIRRSKSMVYDTADPNHRSAGSFFTNPIVDEAFAHQLEQSLEDGLRLPRYPAGEGKVKLSAAWLIQHSGLPKGFKMEASDKVGLSTKHVLALTNRGGATAGELLKLAAFVQQRVQERFGVELVPEPVFV